MELDAPTPKVPQSLNEAVEIFDKVEAQQEQRLQESAHTEISYIENVFNFPKKIKSEVDAVKQTAAQVGKKTVSVIRNNRVPILIGLGLGVAGISAAGYMLLKHKSKSQSVKSAR